MTSSNEKPQLKEVTHRQAMASQHSPFTTGVSCLALVFAMISCSAKENGYDNTRHMVSDAFSKVVKIIADASVKKFDIPAQAVIPK